MRSSGNERSSGRRSSARPRLRSGSGSGPTRLSRSGKSRAAYGSGAAAAGDAAMDLEQGVFTWHDPRRIARSLMHSALVSTRRTAPPYEAAMAVLLFYINRAGRPMKPERRRILNQAREELRKMHRDELREEE